MPSAQHPQKGYSRRQFFKFLNIFLTWLSVADKNKLYILNHNLLHTFLKEFEQNFVSLCSLAHCLFTNCTLLWDPVFFLNDCLLRNIVILLKIVPSEWPALITDSPFLWT
jgi:hypothetical protein